MKRLKQLKPPKRREGEFFLTPDEIERRWIEAKCDNCRACAVLAA
ncbi:hypothetical protein V7S57_02290 [Caulobacter sp. CCNWLY153]